LPDFAQTAVKQIDDQLRVLRDEASRLEAARAALTGGTRRVGRPARNGALRASARSVRERDGRATPARTRRGGNTRANQALELVREKPGITIPEIAKAMKIQPNYLYRVLPRLASDGQVKQDGRGWHPATSSSTSTQPEPVRTVPGRKQTRAAKSKPTASATLAASPPQTGESTSATSSRTTRGATTASVLAALAGGDAMTAGQVATKAGLARPTVSTTLSKLAKPARSRRPRAATGSLQRLRRRSGPSGRPGRHACPVILVDHTDAHSCEIEATRWGAAFVLNPDGVTRTKALGRERIARRLSDALPGGENPLRRAVWQLMRPMLSPNLAQLNRDAFVIDEALESTVRLDEHRGESDLGDLDLGDEDASAA
jgi:hypothetical protein